MLADQGQGTGHVGRLGVAVHRSGEWLSALINFIGGALPAWRDDHARPSVTGETALTSQLCARLNSLSRHTIGWDFLQFKREEPDASDGRRSIDMAVAPSGAIIWIEGREYSEYQTLLPIECKRLPTPNGTDRDEREYLISRFNSTGGVQRFKAGHHAADHARAAMIGYIQMRDIVHWHGQLDAWIDGIVADATVDWSLTDKPALIAHDRSQRSAMFRSQHKRRSGLPPIEIDHLWIEM